MKRYVIALKRLKIQDYIIVKIVANNTENQLKKLFNGEDLSVIENDFELIKYQNVFHDSASLKDAIHYADDVLKNNKLHGIKTIIFTDRYYPENLKKINNPPPILYYKGACLTKKHRKALACIGTREATKFSLNATNYLIPQWVNEEFVIISGLAKGVDTFSHTACITSKGITIAVLAHGLDQIYPLENEELANKIIELGGTLISEYPIGTKPDKFRFVERNRLIVGLSQGTVVFETKVKSGTMHAVQDTLNQNKPVFCPNPGNGNLIEQQEGLRYLIENNKAIQIENGANFEVPIYKLGYKLKHSPLRLNKIKEVYIKSLLNNSNVNIDFSVIEDGLRVEENRKKASFTVNKDKYEQLKELAYKNHLSTKDILNGLIEAVLSKNE